MEEFEIVVKIKASDIMMATVLQKGVQNIIDELGEHQDFLIELSDKNKAKAYKNQIIGFSESPIIKNIANRFFKKV